MASPPTSCKPPHSRLDNISLRLTDRRVSTAASCGALRTTRTPSESGLYDTLDSSVVVGATKLTADYRSREWAKDDSCASPRFRCSRIPRWSGVAWRKGKVARAATARPLPTPCAVYRRKEANGPPRSAKGGIDTAASVDGPLRRFEQQAIAVREGGLTVASYANALMFTRMFKRRNRRECGAMPR